ncbi:glycoside hydrolase domain-containing protein [Eubacterium sp. 1001713B170207_170306_E7]|uniref:glycoside hydrolase domain-containing protein n=1 Tax=Eubacterium sp. 1001713B170207_170306_E7 TaxID=2787097 RepID=UPI00189B9AE9|nr:glycoside hydrolase domain-containing protein [Eubacterium sp. 1001713B170207_170306_E7]
MDQKVLMTQKWLNATYKNLNGYISCTEDGQTGNGTVASLISALQIEIGVSTPTGEFGPMTAELCPTVQSGAKGHIVNIIQGGLWCKGFSSQDLTQDFDNTTVSGVNQFKMAAGLTADGKVDAKTMKGLLSTDAVVLISGGDSRIRAIQQALNNKYSAYFWMDLNICPCDGVYGRNTCNALLYAFQKEVGIDAPNGVFGPGTAQGANDHNVALNSKQTALVYLLQYMLYVNGFNPGSFNGIFDTSVENAVINFQSLMALEADGWVGLSTWAALLISKGNVDRSCNACDCTDRITNQRAQYLKSIGINYVGRYITGYWAVSISEISLILEAGMKFVPIFERSGNDLSGNMDVTDASYFTHEQGRQDALYAASTAQELGLPENTTIYFAVDFDAYDFEVDSNILEYFRALSVYLLHYNVGIYGPRNVCTRVSNAGYAQTSYVADMSTGFSGNIGVRIPSNWAFDQFYETSYGSGDSQINIDKVMASGQDTGVSSLTIPNVAKGLCNEMLKILHIDPSIGWNWNQKTTIPGPFIDIEYKFGLSGSFTPMVDTSTIPSSDKATITINNGEFEKGDITTAEKILDTLTATNKAIINASGGIQTSVAFANSINHGTLTISFSTVDGFPTFNIQVKQLVYSTSVENRNVYFEISFKMKGQPDYQQDLDNIVANHRALLYTGGIVLAIILLIAAVPTGGLTASTGAALMIAVLLAINTYNN